MHILRKYFLKRCQRSHKLSKYFQFSYTFLFNLRIQCLLMLLLSIKWRNDIVTKIFHLFLVKLNSLLSLKMNLYHGWQRRGSKRLLASFTKKNNNATLHHKYIRIGCNFIVVYHIQQNARYYFSHKNKHTRYW